MCSIYLVDGEVREISLKDKEIRGIPEIKLSTFNHYYIIRLIVKPEIELNFVYKQYFTLSFRVVSSLPAKQTKILLNCIVSLKSRREYSRV